MEIIVRLSKFDSPALGLPFTNSINSGSTKSINYRAIVTILGRKVKTNYSFLILSTPQQ